MSVLFLSPPRRHDGSKYLFNNATLSLASYLARRDMEAWVEPLAGPQWRERLARALDRRQPAVVAVSCKWWDTLYGAVEVARLVKEHRPSCKVVCGGQTATSFASELVTVGGFDAVIRGDGELPLLEYARGKPTCNLTTADGTLPHTYVQPRGGTEDLTLVPDLSTIADTSLLHHAGFTAPYVWTGKGCQSACLYCAGSSYGHKKNFGRTGYLYRPLEQTLADMQALAPWTRGCFMYDFDPVTDPGRLDYYAELFAQLPQGVYHGALYCWSLPTLEFVDLCARTFASAVISVDAQTYSEPLRRRLADRNQIKPFASDAEIVAVLERIESHGNLHASVYGIVGLATETAEDVELASRFSESLQRRFAPILQAKGVNFTPLTIEPDSLMDRNPGKYGLEKLRSGFQDYLEFTGSCFARSGGGVFGAPYSPDLPHPYGIRIAGDAPDRVYHDFQRLKSAVDGLSESHEAQQAVAALAVGRFEVALQLRSRSIFQDDWRLVLWAVDEALRLGLPQVRVDARAAQMRVPPWEVLEYDERLDYLGPRVGPLREALASRRLRLVIGGTRGQSWGFLEELGAEIKVPRM